MVHDTLGPEICVNTAADACNGKLCARAHDEPMYTMLQGAYYIHNVDSVWLGAGRLDWHLVVFCFRCCGGVPGSHTISGCATVVFESPADFT